MFALFLQTACAPFVPALAPFASNLAPLYTILTTCVFAPAFTPFSYIAPASSPFCILCRIEYGHECGPGYTLCVSICILLTIYAFASFAFFMPKQGLKYGPDYSPKYGFTE